MRVLQIVSLYRPLEFGGAERSTRELAEGLVYRGHTVAVATVAPPGLELQDEEDGPPAVTRIRSNSTTPLIPSSAWPDGAPRTSKVWHLAERFRLSTALRLRRAIRAFQPDVVHSNLLWGLGPLAWSAASGTPIVHTFRDFYLLCINGKLARPQNCDSVCSRCRLASIPFRIPPRRPEIFVGVSESIVSAHYEFGFLKSSDHVEVIPNRPEMKTLRRTPTEITDRHQKVFGFIGKVAPYKGIWTVLQAFGKLRDPAARFVVAGAGEASEIARLRKLMDQDSRILYVGHIEAEDFYSRVSTVLIPSQWREPYGRVAAEAIYAGRQVIVSGIGGLPEIVHAAGRGEVVRDFLSPVAWHRAMERERDNYILASGPSQYLSLPDPTAAYEAVYKKAVALFHSKAAS